MGAITVALWKLLVFQGCIRNVSKDHQHLGCTNQVVWSQMSWSQLQESIRKVLPSELSSFWLCFRCFMSFMCTRGWFPPLMMSLHLFWGDFLPDDSWASDWSLFKSWGRCMRRLCNHECDLAANVSFAILKYLHLTMDDYVHNMISIMMISGYSGSCSCSKHVRHSVRVDIPHTINQ